jgi:hypothetical protein
LVLQSTRKEWIVVNETTIDVAIARIGGERKNYTLLPGSVVADLFSAASESWGNDEVRVTHAGQQERISSDRHPLSNGDSVLIMTQPRGGQKVVKVGEVGGEVREFAIPDNGTVGDALEAAGLDADGDLRLNSRQAYLDDQAPDGATVIVTRRIIGGD